tara:strand:- start:145 stop:405 length:261 start_codon:yes stop_codon:yes gene_type:complete
METVYIVLQTITIGICVVIQFAVYYTRGINKIGALHAGNKANFNQSAYKNPSGGGGSKAESGERNALQSEQNIDIRCPACRNDDRA